MFNFGLVAVFEQVNGRIWRLYFSAADGNHWEAYYNEHCGVANLQLGKFEKM